MKPDRLSVFPSFYAFFSRFLGQLCLDQGQLARKSVSEYPCRVTELTSSASSALKFRVFQSGINPKIKTG